MYFEGSNGFEFLKFWIILSFKRRGARISLIQINIISNLCILEYDYTKMWLYFDRNSYWKIIINVDCTNQLSYTSARHPLLHRKAQLVRVVNRQSKDPGSNPGTVESVSFSTERFLILWKLSNSTLEFILKSCKDRKDERTLMTITLKSIDKCWGSQKMFRIRIEKSLLMPNKINNRTFSNLIKAFNIQENCKKNIKKQLEFCKRSEIR